MTDKQIDNLKELAYYLRFVLLPKLEENDHVQNGFDIDIKFYSKINPLNLDEAIEYKSCGCAVGWAFLNDNFKSYRGKDSVYQLRSSTYWTEYAKNVFGVDDNDIRILFMPNSYKEPTIENVISRIEDFTYNLSLDDDVEKNNFILSRGHVPDFGTKVEISEDGKTGECGFYYLENRTCMLAGHAGGFGYFDEGFATEDGLIIDTPRFWRVDHG